MKLSDRSWGVFVIGDLFSVKRPPARNKDNYEDGEVPFVASGSVNNGVMKCCKPNEDEQLDNACCITVSPVDGSSFYQPYSFLGRGGAGSSVLMLYAENMNLYRGQFIARMIANTCTSKYTYGHMGNKDGIKRERIMLPITDDGEPDYQFMEDYIRELMATKRKQYQNYVEKRIAELGLDNSEIEDYEMLMDGHEWKSFRIVDMFDLVRGREGNMASLEKGNIPLVSARNIDNGLKGFVDNPKKVIRGNCITLNNDGDGGAGLAYYQPVDMALDTHVTALAPKSEMSSYTMLFISECLSTLHGFFGHGHSISNKRASNIRVMLPVTDDGEPDYEFMEEFGRRLMAKKYSQYLAFLKMSDTIETVEN